MDLSNFPIESLLTELKPVAVFLVTYCFLFTALGLVFRNERKARLLVAVILSVYATNSILVNGWDRLVTVAISSTVGAIVKFVLGSLSKFHKTPD